MMRTITQDDKPFLCMYFFCCSPTPPGSFYVCLYIYDATIGTLIKEFEDPKKGELGEGRRRVTRWQDREYFAHLAPTWFVDSC